VPNSTANGVNAVVILVVEDELFLRVDITGCLREAGSSGEEAMALCQSNSSIDMVFTDITLMGSLNGWDVAERFRMQRPDAPVLYASADAIDRERCAPGSVFIAKPYRPDDILTACQGLRPR
jgi:CheY-like chemotaxis protein